MEQCLRAEAGKRRLLARTSFRDCPLTQARGNFTTEETEAQAIAVNADNDALGSRQTGAPRRHYGLLRLCLVDGTRKMLFFVVQWFCPNAALRFDFG
jgi:hypothetical protein